MSVFDHMAWAKRQKTGSVGAKAVLMALAERTGDEPVAFPSQIRLAEETEQSERTVRTHLARLEELGLIKRSRRYVDSRGRQLPRGKACNQYELLIDQPANIAGGPDEPDDGPTGNEDTTNRQAVAGEEPWVDPHENHTPAPPLELTLVEDQPSAAPTAFGDQVVAVFDLWRQVAGHPAALLDNARKRKIAAALRSHGYDVTCAAVNGLAYSSWHLGENDRSTRYDGLGVILKNADSIERFAGLHLDPSTRPKSRDPLDGLPGSPPARYGPQPGSVPADESVHPVLAAQRRREAANA